MKNIIKIMLLIVIIAAVSFVMPGLMDSTEYSIQAREADLSEEEVQASPDAFTVVEIVPYVGMTEISYLVGGQEPIDGNLMNHNNANGDLSFLGGAINPYKNYMEKPLPSSGNVDNGWNLGFTTVTQNGYFEYVGYNKGATYDWVNWVTSYVRVANGTGTHRAELDSSVPENTYYGGEVTNRKNVKAYFVYGKPNGVSLYNSTSRFKPECVMRIEDRTGDYDYDLVTGAFYLNIGKGEYDVLFSEGWSNNPYYMMNNYEIVDDNSGYYSFPIKYTAMPNNQGGNYVRDTGANGNIFNYNRWSGTYRWTQDNQALNKANYSTEGSKIWVRNQKITIPYQYRYGVTLINNEWFKRHSLGVPANLAKVYPVEVITITPEDLSKPENQHYIDEADMFYINANWRHNTTGYFRLFETYSPEAASLPQKYQNVHDFVRRDNLNFAVHDLDWPTTVKLFKKIAGIGSNKTPAIIDSKYAQDALGASNGNDDVPYRPLMRSINLSILHGIKTGTICNLAKLYIMLYQRNTVDFYNAFLNPAVPGARLITQVNSAVNTSGNTGSFVRPPINLNPSYSPTDARALYWHEDTFLDFGLNEAGDLIYYNLFQNNDMIEDGIKHINLFGTTTDLMDNVLITNGQDLFTDKFLQPLNLPSDVRAEAALHVSIVEGQEKNQNSLTLANITNVITNNGTGYPNTGGVAYPEGGKVEGAPSSVPPAEDTSGLEEGLRTFKRVLNLQPTADFTAGETNIRNLLGNNIQIINMTSTQFNGNIEDINSRYDMIYLGSGYGRLNVSGTTINYNVGSSLKNNYYFKTGDTKKIPDVVNSSNIVTVNYQGNDISSKRRADLEEFLSAGFPIIADSNVFGLTQIKSDTNIHSLISTAKSNYRDNFLNYADLTSSTLATKIAAMVKLLTALNITRPLINLVDPVLPANADVNYIYIPSTNLLTIKFALLPKGYIPTSYTYDAHLYIDTNGDGIFSDDEELAAIPKDASSANGLRENRNKFYTYQYNMNGLNGVYQWRLTLEREDDDDSTPEKRKLEAIRTSVTGYAAVSNKQKLSILHIRDNNASFNLQNMVNDTGSLFKPLTSGLKDYELEFKTMTVQEFRKEFESPNSKYTDLASSKLARYHLLILDNPTVPLVSTLQEETDKGIYKNIMDEATAGLSIVFTKGALVADRTSNSIINQQKQYYPNGKLSFLSAQTYNYINRKTTETSNLYIYSKLNTNGSLSSDSTYNTTYLTKTNEGTISNYPYQIGPFITTGNNSYSNETTIDFNPAADQRLIGWYSLSDNRSPVVNPSVTVANRYTGIYSSSPNDVKNNYYLFSNGLCYYSGINFNNANTARAENEIKLFVNTIIAAYQASGKVISNPPVVTYENPRITTEGATKQLVVTEQDIIGTDLILKFKLFGSSSKMSLMISLDDTNNPHGDWDEKIYPVNGNNLGAAVSITNTSKILENKTYALKIPISTIGGTHKLNIKAENSEGKTGEASLRLIFNQNPVVTIIDPEPLPNSRLSYLYVDIDYNALDTNEDYLDTADNLVVRFKVADAVTNFKLNINSEGADLLDVNGTNVIVTDIMDGQITLFDSLPIGEYIMKIPVSLMRNHSSREFIIKADVNGYVGEAKVTLLRRSLFPLD